MNVPNKLQEITIEIDKRRPKFRFEWLPHVGCFSTDSAGPSTKEALHESAHGHIGDLQYEMDSVNFPTERMYQGTRMTQHRRKQPFKYCVVRGIGKQGLSITTGLDDVV